MEKIRQNSGWGQEFIINAPRLRTILLVSETNPLIGEEIEKELRSGNIWLEQELCSFSIPRTGEMGHIQVLC